MDMPPDDAPKPSPFAALMQVNWHVRHENYLVLARVLREIEHESTERPVVRLAYILVRKAMKELMSGKPVV